MRPFSTIAISLGFALGCSPAAAPTRHVEPAPPPSGAPAAKVEPITEPVTLKAIDLAKAKGYLTEIDSLCKADGGKLWGESLCGPFLLVDSKSREVVANRRDRDGVFAATNHDGVFIGRWPETEGIANTAHEWKGTLWTMVGYDYLDEDPKARQALLMHEAFHRVQPELALVPREKTDGAANKHIDERDGRFWLQLEWNALEAALAEGASERDRHLAIRDALTFRAARRTRFPEAAGGEVALEIMEGLAEYTGNKLAGWSTADTLKATARRRSNDSSFVRSFAYVSGPLYGYALDATGADWRKRVAVDADLGALLGDLTKEKPGPASEAKNRGDAYGGKSLAKAEDERARQRTAQIAEWRHALVDGPILAVDLKSVTGRTFDPRTVHPISKTETVYERNTFIASWGTLKVDDGAILVDDANARATVSLAGASADSLAGKGWSLTLATGWTVGPATRKGDLTLVHRP